MSSAASALPGDGGCSVRSAGDGPPSTADDRIATIIPKVLQAMPFHQKTEEMIKDLDDVWEEFVARNHMVLPATTQVDSGNP